MKKINFIIAIFLTFFALKPLTAQISDSLKLNSGEFIKNNKFAVVFELGTVVGRTSLVERYNFLAKYHIYENFAVRFGGDFGVSETENTFGYSALYDDFSSYSFDLYGDLQYYFLRKSLIKPFVTFGSFYSKDYYYEEKDNWDDFRYRNEWSLGLMATLGVEVFLINNVSLVSEYITKCYYASFRSRYITSGNLYSDDKGKVLKATGNTFRIGFSVYF